MDDVIGPRPGGSRRRSWSPEQLRSLRVPPRPLAIALLVTVLCSYGLLAIVGVVFETHSVLDGVVSGVLVLALVLLQLYISRPARPPRWPQSHLALVLQAGMVFLPILVFGPTWFGFPGILAGSVLLVLPRIAGVPLAALVVLTLAAVSAVSSPLTDDHGTGLAIVYLITSATTSALAVYGLSTLTRLVVEAQDAREELGRVAVARERLRFARNVHELLGQNLSAITLRCELVARLIGLQTERAGAELGQVLALARRASEDVRTVVGLRRGLIGEDSDPDAVQAPEAMAPVPDRAGRFAQLVLAVVLFDFVTVATVGVFVHHGTGRALIAAACGVAAALVVARLSLRDAHRSYPALVVLAVLAFAPAAYLGPSWHGMSGFLGAGLLLVLPGMVAVPALAVLIAVTVLLEYLDPAPTEALMANLFYVAVGLVVVSIVVYGLATVARLVVQVNEARADLTRLAVARERIRIARDVHDLLGLGLSAITLKCDLASRLLDTRPDRARAEVNDVLVASRQALTDVRSVIGGEQRLSLDDECRTAESILAAAQVEVRLRRVGTLPGEPAGTVLACVLREGVTNVLRHSDAKWCEISLRRAGDVAELDIVNDGVRTAEAPEPGPPSGPGVGGNGLGNMSDRVGSLGGRLVVDTDHECYRLTARVPVRG
jgi:two-component system, NarL family, sensor histidine kinase DesK